jgi:phosphoglycolate phosphatase-like HAD superfamily hydrolase
LTDDKEFETRQRESFATASLIVHVSGFPARSFQMRIEPAFLFDLDGTLVDSVYQHVLAWKTALDAEGIELSVWRIHRKIGMSGGLFTHQLLRETEVEIDPERIDANHARRRCVLSRGNHAERYRGCHKS